ncbi:MAG: hypoxanthine phosphoribosyltransferase [Clostridia bacterium]|nr:hypoxanthine phosphoribosyltransferase [Clostridia bacterium]
MKNKYIRIILSKRTIQKRVKQLAKQISSDYAGTTPVIICMLKGAIYFFTDLVKNISIPVTIEFARLSSYKNGTTGGDMELVADIKEKIEGKHVILVEDIVDSGKTLAYFIDMLNKKNPASVKICTFLDKLTRREVDVKSEYIGFDIDCGFVIGYGLDYAEKYRELPYLAEVLDPSKI